MKLETEGTGRWPGTRRSLAFMRQGKQTHGMEMEAGPGVGLGCVSAALAAERSAFNQISYLWVDFWVTLDPFGDALERFWDDLGMIWG